MDILAARKKAAERSKKKAEAIEPPPVAVMRDPEPVVSPPAPAAAETAPPPVHEVPAAAAKAGQTPVAPALYSPDDLEVIPDADLDEEISEPSERETETLAIRLGNEDYLVPVERVREVLKLREATPVPHATEHVTGVISLRGTVLPVIDLAKRLGLPAGIRDDKSRIVVVGLDDEDAGLVVDRVAGVVRFPPGAVEAVPENVEQGAGAEYLAGIVRREGKLFILLDLEKAAGK